MTHAVQSIGGKGAGRGDDACGQSTKKQDAVAQKDLSRHSRFSFMP